jgi:uncharacterized protein (TIGR00725 family)
MGTSRTWIWRPGTGAAACLPRNLRTAWTSSLPAGLPGAIAAIHQVASDAFRPAQPMAPTAEAVETKRPPAPVVRYAPADQCAAGQRPGGGTPIYARPTMQIQIAVIGGGQAPPPAIAVAEAVGAALASAGAIVVCGGLGGAMAAACRGAKSAGGLTVGILPGRDASDANPWVDVVIPTGLGETRNALVVGSAAAVIAVDGEYGTLSEIALALRSGIPVIGIGTWSLTRPDGEMDAGIVPMEDPVEAAAVAVRLASG